MRLFLCKLLKGDNHFNFSIISSSQLTSKIMKRNSLYLILLFAALFTACTKTETPNEVKTSVTLFSKGYTYFDDTTSAGPVYVDSLEYNDKNQVAKINVYTNDADTIVYTFKYNTNDDITEMHVRDAKRISENGDYYLYYNAAQKLDSMREVSSLRTFLNIFKYNSQNALSDILIYYPNLTGEIIFYSKTTYFRSTQLDSISSYNYTAADQVVTRPMNANITETKPVLDINRAYLLMEAERYSWSALFYPETFYADFSHQFASPDELIIRNGATMDYTGGKLSEIFTYSNLFSLNTQGAIRLYTYTCQLNPALKIYTKFEYITK